MSSGGTNTVTTSTQPPAAYQSALGTTLGQIQNTAATPYSNYSGSLEAPFSPDQTASFQETENAQGMAQPYINSAAGEFGAATSPLWSSVQQFSPSAVQQYESPYTSDVVNATQSEFNNQNEQQANQLNGNLISQGAFGGDRSGVAQAALAGQQQLSEAPTIAGLENSGYTNALGEFNTQQQNQLGANEANSWLASQAGFGLSSLGSEAQGEALQGASALNSVGNQEQAQAQSSLNIPYEEWSAQQAYPFQTGQWLANMETNLAAGAGGTGTTSYPAASTASQVLGGAAATTGILGQTGAFGSSGYLSSLFGAGAGAGDTAAILGAGDLGEAGSAAALGNAVGDFGMLGSIATGGRIDRDTSGGVVIPFPGHRAHRGGVFGEPANDDWQPEPARKLATGGPASGVTAFLNSPAFLSGVQQQEAALPPSAGTPTVTSLQGGNGVSIPQINMGSSSGLGASALQNYLSGVAATAWQPPRGPQPTYFPTAATPLALAAPGAAPAAAAALPAATAAVSSTAIPGDPSGLSSWALTGRRRGGGITGYDAGGLVEDDYGIQPPTDDTMPDYAADAPVVLGDLNGSPTAPTAPAVHHAPSHPQHRPMPPMRAVASTASTADTSSPSSAIPAPPDRSNLNSPWAALTATGLGIMAGKSPFALENIGQGGLEGLNFASKQQEIGAQEQQRQEDAAWRRDYQKGIIDVRNRGADTRNDVAVAQIQRDLADAAKAQAGAAGTAAAKGRWTYAGNDPKTGLPILMDSTTGETKIGASPIGMKTADAARVAAENRSTSAAANTRERGISATMLAHPEMSAEQAAASWDKISPPTSAAPPQGQNAPGASAPASPVAPPPAAINALKNDPSKAPDFIQKYGADAYNKVFAPQ